MKSMSVRGQWKKFLLEFVGTLAISFFGPAAIVVALLIPGLDSQTRLFFDALVPGVTLAVLISTIAKYSGSHVNPAITVTFLSSRSFSRRLLVPYVSFQLMGGLLAGFALSLVFDSSVPSAYLGSNRIAEGVTPAEAIVLEIVGTMVLCLVVLSVVAFIRSIPRQGIIAGATLTTLIFILGPISGGSFHPFRSLGPALFSGYFQGLYVYLTTPIVGAALAGLIFRAIRSRSA
jgi:glycerol uptake facilitator-like aquaporin